MMSWSIVIAAVALLFSVICFFLFVRNAVAKPVPAKVVDEAAARVQAGIIDLSTIGDLVKALADAFSKVGPGALALIGALLVLLLSGAAAGVYDLRGAPTAGETKAHPRPNAVADTGNGSVDAAGRNGSSEMTNGAGNAQ